MANLDRSGSMEGRPLEYSTDQAHITNIYGYQATDLNRSKELALGDIYDQEVKSILIDMAFYPHKAGTHPVLELEWDYVDVTETVKPCKVHLTVQAEFTNDIDLLNLPTDAAVDKQVKITETALAIEKAMQAFDNGDIDHGKMMLQAQADDLLKMAVQMDDKELRAESAKLYEKLEHFTYSPIMRKELHAQKYQNMKRKR